MRWVVTIACVAAAALSGCGGDAADVQPTPSGTEPQRLDPEDRRRAHQLTLRLSDFPKDQVADSSGWKERLVPQTGSTYTPCFAALRDSKVTGRSEALYVAGDLFPFSVYSVGTLATTDTDAQDVFTALSDEASAECVRDHFRDELQRTVDVEIEERKLQPHGDQVGSWRIIESWVEDGARATLILNLLTVRVGRAVALIVDQSFGLLPEEQAKYDNEMATAEQKYTASFNDLASRLAARMSG